jgi:hypothetical protein
MVCSGKHKSCSHARGRYPAGLSPATHRFMEPEITFTVVLTKTEDNKIDLKYNFAPTYVNDSIVHAAGVRMIELFLNDAAVLRHEIPVEQKQTPASDNQQV